MRSASATGLEAADPSPEAAEALALALDASAAFHEAQAGTMESLPAGNWRRWP